MIAAVRYLTCNIGLWALILPLVCSFLLLLASFATAGYKRAGNEALSDAHFSWGRFAAMVITAFFAIAVCVWALLVHLTQERDMLIADSAADLDAMDKVRVRKRHDVWASNVWRIGVGEDPSTFCVQS